MAGVESLIVEEKQAPSRAIDREKVVKIKNLKQCFKKIENKISEISINLLSDLSVASACILQRFWSPPQHE
jgi:hypothetical protein